MILTLALTTLAFAVVALWMAQARVLAPRRVTPPPRRRARR